jgi:hypothetical protein
MNSTSGRSAECKWLTSARLFSGLVVRQGRMNFTGEFGAGTECDKARAPGRISLPRNNCFRAFKIGKVLTLII